MNSKSAKFLSAVLACAVILSACDSTVTEPETTKASEESETTTTTSATETSSDITTAEVTESAETVYERLKNVPLENLLGRKIKFEENVPYIFEDSWIPDHAVTTDGSESIYANQILSRKSTGILTTDEDIFKGKVRSSVSDAKEQYIDGSNGSIYFKIDKVTDSEVIAGSAEASTYDYDYHIVHAFVKKHSFNDYEVIIDPVYMDNLPIMSDLTEDFKFDINGTEVYADTLKFDAYNTSPDMPVMDTDKYYYAKVSLKYMDLFYNTESGAKNTCDIYEISLLTEDTDSVISGEFSKYTENSTAPEDILTKGIINLKSEILDGETIAVIPFDMDFDGTCEVAVEKQPPDGRYDMATYVTYDFYDISEDGSTVKLGSLDICVDNMYFLESAVYDGRKGWLADGRKSEMSDGLYFLTVQNGALEIKEILAHSWNEESEYYYGGERIYFDESVRHFEEKSFGNYSYGGDVTVYSWGGFEERYEYELYYMIYLSEKVNYTVLNGKKVNASDYRTKRTDMPPYFDAFEMNDEEYARFAELRACKAVYAAEIDENEEYHKYFSDGAKAKPVIYLYPEEETEVSVQVDFNDGSELTCTYPEYNNGWRVTAEPDGTLFDESGNEYYCLYWESTQGERLRMNEGFCVSGTETADFLREKLMYMGLTAREANEFIIYWLPIMEKNPYNVVTFHTDSYTDAVPLSVSPAPDSVIRVFMTFYASETEIEIAEQDLPQYNRDGFTVVEWGGSEY